MKAVTLYTVVEFSFEWVGPNHVLVVIIIRRHVVPFRENRIVSSGLKERAHFRPVEDVIGQKMDPEVVAVYAVRSDGDAVSFIAL